ncbi:WD40/YVTN/BNR-like repeat-containing protein [Hymenobacter terricola]|uniref:WD40/YVTN/BNR-like repeat-containing protein n=1 Tax=Hymenobacter terricola TaxID=2819236 RepID=UPI001B316ABF|nr:YCF48-related protein [Hymenobacter terricola]
MSSVAANGQGDVFILVKGTDAQVLKSSDAGSNRTLAGRAAYTLNKIAFDHAAGYCIGHNGKTFRSTDNGSTWADAATLNAYYLNELAFWGGTGYCVANYLTIYQTTDNGVTWRFVRQSDFTSLSVQPLTATSAVVFGAGRHSGGDYGTYDGSFKQTTTAGATWTETELTNTASIQFASFYSATDGSAVAGQSLIRVHVK